LLGRDRSDSDRVLPAWLPGYPSFTPRAGKM
jgi:hypothetical protein